MNKNFTKVLGLISGLLVSLLITGSASAQAPDPFNPNNRFLTLEAPVGMPVIPVMEGWYPNDDGSITISFGYHNRNKETIDIPLGENNYIEPARFNGMQPTHFEAERDTGVFTVTLPADMAKSDVWWYLKTGENEILKVPGRGGAGAYELDRNPRPQGSISPMAWFDGGEKDSGPDGPVNTRVVTAKVGQPVVLSVNIQDNSVRDTSDPRYAKPLTVHTQWFEHQGPGMVTFTKHESTVDPEPPKERPNLPASFRRREPQPSEVTLPTTEGTVKVYASFSAPGEYIVRLRADNWNSPDSSEGNQCCWTNAYQRVTVSP
jgi:hypothetical protein